jgi:hypothetical protein
MLGLSETAAITDKDGSSRPLKFAGEIICRLIWQVSFQDRDGGRRCGELFPTLTNAMILVERGSTALVSTQRVSGKQNASKLHIRCPAYRAIENSTPLTMVLVGVPQWLFPLSEVANSNLIRTGARYTFSRTQRKVPALCISDEPAVEMIINAFPCTLI